MKGHHIFEPLYENNEVVLTKQEHITKLQFCKAWTKSTKNLQHNKMVKKTSKEESFWMTHTVRDHEPQNFIPSTMEKMG